MATYVNVTLVDAYGRTTTKKFESEAATVANAQTYLDTLLTALAAISDLGQVKAVFEYPLVVTTPIAAQSGANVDVGATLHCVISPGKGYGLKVPGIKATMLNGDGSVDIADGAITAWVALFGSGDHWRVSDGEHIASLTSGELDK